MTYLKALINYLLQPDNIFLFVFVAAITISINIAILVKRERYYKKVENVISDRIEKAIGFKKIQDKLYGLIYDAERDEIAIYKKKYERVLLNIDDELDKIWNERKKLKLYINGLSKNVNDELFQNAIKKTYFQYWAIDDILKIVGSINRDASINNLEAYITSDFANKLKNMNIGEDKIGFNYQKKISFYQSICEYLKRLQLILSFGTK